MMYFVLAMNGTNETLSTVSGPFRNRGVAEAAGLALLSHMDGVEILSAAQMDAHAGAFSYPISEKMRRLVKRHPLSVTAAKAALETAETAAAKAVLVEAAGGKP